MLTRRDEQQFAELHALTLELGESTQLTLERIREARAQLAPQDPLLAFVHIPKTAGGTVTSMLTAAYSKTAIKKTGNYVRNPEKTERKIAVSLQSEGQVTAGHTPYGTLRAQLPPDTRYMTFLREPVDRVLSHYYRHIERKKQRSPARRRLRLELGTASPDKADSLEEALVEMRLPQISNLATRFLSGRRSPQMTGDLPASALDDAKESLSEFTFIGIQERFDESLVLLQRMLGLELVPYFNRHVSADTGRPAVDEIPDDQRALILEHNRLDVELYAFGLGLFEDAVARAGEEFAADVEDLRALSADVNEEAIQTAREWLDRRLPPGTSSPGAALRDEAREAGVSMTALKHVLNVVSAQREHDPDGQMTWTRTESVQDDERAA